MTKKFMTDYLFKRLRHIREKEWWVHTRVYLVLSFMRGKMGGESVYQLNTKTSILSKANIIENSGWVMGTANVRKLRAEIRTTSAEERTT